MGVQRTASSVWEGDLQTGSGTTSFESSGAIAPVRVSFPARSGEPQGMTSPEELVAAAHASCYNMGLSSALTKGAGVTPEEIRTTATATFSTDGGPHVASIALHVRARVPGISEEDFQKAAEGAKENCPISKLVKGNTEVTLDAALE